MIEDSIYHLKMEYGRPATFVREVTSDVDYAAGTGIVTATEYPIQKVIILPRASTIIRRTLDRPFNFGGVLEKNQRWLLVDFKDLPIYPNKGDYLLFKGKKDIIQAVYDYDNAAYLLRTRFDE